MSPVVQGQLRPSLSLTRKRMPRRPSFLGTFGLAWLAARFSPATLLSTVAGLADEPPSACLACTAGDGAAFLREALATAVFLAAADFLLAATFLAGAFLLGCFFRFVAVAAAGLAGLPAFAPADLPG